MTFSMRSLLTSLRKSEYRTSTGAPPRDWMTGTSGCSEGGMSTAMERAERGAIAFGGAKAWMEGVERRRASVENFIVVYLSLIDDKM